MLWMCCRSEGVQQIWIVAPSYAATIDCYARLSTKITSAARLLGCLESSNPLKSGFATMLVSYRPLGQDSSPAASPMPTLARDSATPSKLRGATSHRCKVAVLWKPIKGCPSGAVAVAARP